jgi:hypothetical protein
MCTPVAAKHGGQYGNPFSFKSHILLIYNNNNNNYCIYKALILEKDQL